MFDREEVNSLIQIQITDMTDTMELEPVSPSIAGSVGCTIQL